MSFGNEIVVNRSGGSFGWEKIEHAISMPKDTVFSNDPAIYLAQNARAMKFFIKMKAPREGYSDLYIDDLAIISWETEYLNKEIIVSTPHAMDFLKVQTDPGTYTLHLEFKKYKP